MKIFKKILWGILQTVFDVVITALLVSGFYYEIEGLQNIAKLLIWLVVFGNFLVLFGPGSAMLKVSQLRFWLTRLRDIVNVLICVWFGWIITVIFSVLGIVAYSVAWLAARDTLESDDTEADN